MKAEIEQLQVQIMNMTEVCWDFAARSDNLLVHQDHETKIEQERESAQSEITV